MAIEPSDPRWDPTCEELGRLCTKGARIWLIREQTSLLALRCVEEQANALVEERSALLETADSDGRAEALVVILRTLIAEIRNSPPGRLLAIMLDLERSNLGANAETRRELVGARFRGEDAKPLGVSVIRQLHQPRSVELLAGLLLAHEDAIGSPDG